MFFSTDKLNLQLRKLTEDLKGYGELRLASFRLDMVSKLTRLLSVVIIGAVLLIIVTLALIFLSLMAVSALTPWLGSTTAACGLMGGIYLLLAIICYCKRKSWIYNPVANALAHLFLDKK